LGKTALIKMGVEEDQLQSLGDLAITSVSDLFVAMMQ